MRCNSSPMHSMHCLVFVPEYVKQASTNKFLVVRISVKAILILAISVSISSTGFLLLSTGVFTSNSESVNQPRTNYIDASEQKSTKATRDGVVVTVEGLKRGYSSGEALYFTVTTKGNGIFCPKPIAYIVKPETGKMVWIISNGAPCPLTDAQEIDKTWTMYDIRDQAFPLLVGQLFGGGEYTLVVKYNGAIIEQDFIQY